MDHQPIPTQPARAAQGPGVWLGMVVLWFVWGSTYLAISVAVATIPPFLMAAGRFLLAGMALLAWSTVRDGGLSSWPTRREWRDSLVVGGLLLGGGMGMVAFAEQTIPAGITALLVAMMPVWVALFGRVLLGERLPAMAVVGIVVGFGGVVVLVGPTATGGDGRLDPLGLAAVIGSPIAWSLGSLFASHRAVLPRRPLIAAGAQMVAGGGVLAILAVASGELAAFQVEVVTIDSIAATGYLIVFGSLLAFTTFSWLLRVAPLPLVATYAYVNPIVAVVLGVILLHESVAPRTLAAGAIIVAAVALIVTARSRMPAERPVRAAPESAGVDAFPETG